MAVDLLGVDPVLYDENHEVSRDTFFFGLNSWLFVLFYLDLQKQ